MKQRLLLACLLFSATLTAKIDPSIKGADRLILPPGVLDPVATLPCDDCNGAGFTMQTIGDIEDLGGTYKKRCNTCTGNGKVRRRRTPQEAIDAQKRLRSDFDKEQLKRGHQPFAGAYAPNRALDDLTPAERAHLAHQVPETCEKCYGLTYEECKKCSGKGYTEKKVFKSRNNAKRKKNEEEKTIKAPCEKCTSSGRLICKKCHGEGLKPLCKKCDGTGLTLAKKKTTTADKTRHTITEEVPCKSCNGFGRK